MKRPLIILALLASPVFAQQPPGLPDQQTLRDLANVLASQRNNAQNDAAQLQALVERLQRDLAEAQKKAAACEPKKEDKK